MADYNINAITRRVVFTGSAGLGPYAFSFEILDQDDLAVYFNATSLTITTDYTVTINANGTGSVNIVTGGSVPSTPTASDQIVIVGARDIERVTDFVTAGDLLASSLNEQLDALTIFDQQVAEENKRGLRAPVYDPALVEDGGVVDMTLPAKADRAGRFLAFDGNGNPTATTNVGDFKGDWAASTVYRIGDLVRDTTDDSIYRVNTDHTSSGSLPLNTNTNAAYYDLFVDLSDINASEAAAAASASAAASSASAASTSETNAAASASTASTQATNAASSATSSASSATAAQTAQAAAEAALDTFDDRFLGAKASDPSVDNDGNALQDGAIYYDTTNEIMKVYDLTNTIWRNLALTGTDQTNVNLVAGQISPTNNIATVAGVASDIPTVAGINATHLSNVSSVATEIGILGTADAVADMNTLGTAAIVTDMDTLADRATDIATLADIEDGTTATNAISIVAANLSGITAFADIYSSGPTDPTTNLNEGDLFFNTTSDTLKVYDGAAWTAGVTAGSGFLPLSGGQLTGNLTFSSTQTVDGRDVSVDGAKLDGIEAGATADQTAAEIRVLVESATDSNVFTDADHTKLNGIESGATADQSASEILTAIKTVDGSGSGLDADLLDGVDSGSFLRSDVADTKTSGDLSFADNVKAIFGAGNDLTINHDGSNSFITDSGTGSLYIQGTSGVFIRSADGGENLAAFADDGAVTLYYDNAAKLVTTATGVSVTGTVAATALTGDGSGITNLPSSGYNAPWVNFNGTGTVAIRDSLLTSSISDLGTGDYRHNFSSSCANSSYAVANGGSRDDPESSRTFMINLDNLATGSYDISCHNDGSTSVDFTNVFMIAQGDF